MSLEHHLFVFHDTIGQAFVIYLIHEISDPVALPFFFVAGFG